MRLATNCLIGITTLRSSQVDVTIGQSDTRVFPQIPRSLGPLSRRYLVARPLDSSILQKSRRISRARNAISSRHYSRIDRELTNLSGPDAPNDAAINVPREIVYIARADGPDVTSHRMSGPALRWTMDEVADVSHAS